MRDDYDPNTDAYRSWKVGIDALRTKTIKPVTIVLLGEPVPWAQNSSPRAVGPQVHYRPVPRRQQDYFAALRTAAQQAMLDSDQSQGIITGAVQLDFRAEKSIPRSWSQKKQQMALLGKILPTGRPDLTKLVRLVEDAISGVVIADDAQIVKATHEKVYGYQPKIIVTVRPVEMPVLAHAQPSRSGWFFGETIA